MATKRMRWLAPTVLLAAMALTTTTASPAAAAAQVFRTPETCTTVGEYTSCQSSSGISNTTTTPSGLVSTSLIGTNRTTVTGPDVDIDFTVSFNFHSLSKPGEPNDFTVVQRTTDVNGGVRCHQTVVLTFTNGELRHSGQNFSCV
jgi:hypothetical protein